MDDILMEKMARWSRKGYLGIKRIQETHVNGCGVADFKRKVVVKGGSGGVH